MGDSQREPVIPLISAANSKFFSGLLLALSTALLAASGRYDYRVIVVDGGLQATELNALETTLQRIAAQKSLSVSLERIPALLPEFMQFPLRNGSPLAWARLALPYILDVEHFVYIDSDTLCFKGIEAVWEAREGDVPLVAVNDRILHLRGDRTARTMVAKADLKKPYFNSGIIGLNSRLFQQERSLHELIQLVQSQERWRFGDQTLLNILFLGRWKRVGDENNLVLTIENAPRLLKAQAPMNLHFVNRYKPWVCLESRTHRYLPDLVWDATYQVVTGEPFPSASTRTLDKATWCEARKKALRYRLFNPARAKIYCAAAQSAELGSDKAAVAALLSVLTRDFPKRGAIALSLEQPHARNASQLPS